MGFVAGVPAKGRVSSASRQSASESTTDSSSEATRLHSASSRPSVASTASIPTPSVSAHWDRHSSPPLTPRSPPLPRRTELSSAKTSAPCPARASRTDDVTTARPASSARAWTRWSAVRGEAAGAPLSASCPSRASRMASAWTCSAASGPARVAAAAAAESSWRLVGRPGVAASCRHSVQSAPRSAPSLVRAWRRMIVAANCPTAMAAPPALPPATSPTASRNRASSMPVVSSAISERASPFSAPPIRPASAIAAPSTERTTERTSLTTPTSESPGRLGRPPCWACRRWPIRKFALRRSLGRGQRSWFCKAGDDRGLISFRAVDAPLLPRLAELQRCTLYRQSCLQTSLQTSRQSPRCRLVAGPDTDSLLTSVPSTDSPTLTLVKQL
eukprot:COSAG04_NODE_535_length_12932_cov_12.604223_2_plen_387_part_00